MSIWASIFDLEDHPPYVYQGSHILPCPGNTPREKGDAVQVAQIPSHITRDGRDDAPEDGVPWPWLRLSVLPEDVVLDRSQVAELHAVLGAWLDATGQIGTSQQTRAGVAG